MKRLFIALLASSFLVAPLAPSLAFAQSAPSFEVAQMKERQTERRVEQRTVKRTIVTKKRWARGHRLSASERRQSANVRDYRRYKLRQPPRGQQWVRVNNDFLLISVATGVIVGLTAN